ncbi:hypothetical protein A2999_00615 [Candidatus Wolfebacteria bacterium RIFCSPLOWO2_01_FULL_38_11]|uniref:General secretion pathway GspH domain-containing protein n=1 Tax=Candidatus Wolfebacteria bacterium RIFCSPLOWO2_01_FULL_38_11 TaxID=1802556 RepID=A0A1F8DQ30_9BACT|nr:MAG: hypothetical protein A2999_00615 [Candidatus Wolfebacteria bacterium RIFCSPLOWO2_01_FULL_38_11]
MKGFTLLEILIVFAILAILSAISVGFYKNYAINSEMDLVKKAMIANLKQARSKSMTGEEGLKWGIHFINSEDDYYEIFSTPADYSSASTTIFSATYFPKTISFIEPITSSTIIFNKINGMISATSTVIFSSQIATSTITITPAGNIY